MEEPNSSYQILPLTLGLPSQTWPPKPPDMTAEDIVKACEAQPFAVSMHATVSRFKGRQLAYKDKATQRELEMMLAAGDCSVKVRGRCFQPVRGGNVYMCGIIMDLESPLNPKTIHSSQHKSLMDQMTSIVLSLHQRGIVHGDIKPANMLICSDSKVRLCDFAEARLVDEDPDLWEGITTTNYISPTRTRNWPHKADPPPMIEDDLYGLGLSIWELYTRKIPFEDVYEDDIIRHLQRGGTVDVEEVQDEGVRAVICRYLRYGGARV